MLNPKRERFFVGAGTSEVIQPQIQSLPAVKNLNDDQRSVVRRVARACTTNMEMPHVSLVQGPPGTGKTATIAALVLQIVQRWEMVVLSHQQQYGKAAGPAPALRILVTAPSNNAVDEVASRLLKIRQMAAPTSRAGELRMLRVGREPAVAPEVRPIRVESLRDKEISSRRRSMGNK